MAILLSYPGQSTVMQSHTNQKEKRIENTISMMLETEENSGVYEMNGSASWPTDDYIFNEDLSRCENGGTLTWNNDKKAVELATTTSDKCYVYFDIDNRIYHERCKEETLACKIAKNYQNDTTLLYHDSSLENGANDASYRYAGANPNNYVCFGSTESPCPNDNLYRIIGVFDSKVKLIKYDYISTEQIGLETKGDINPTTFSTDYKGNKTNISTYDWIPSSEKTKIWKNSELNNALNTSYLTIMKDEWAEKIATTTWHIGGLNKTTATKTNAQNVFNYELGNKKVEDTFNAKVGLMYLNEYYYAASPTYWTYKGEDTTTTDYRVAKNDNWMHMGVNEWTISRINASALAYAPIASMTRLSNTLAAVYDISHVAFFIKSNGVVTTETIAAGSSNLAGNQTLALRPTFSLNKDVNYASGSGTLTNPYRIRI